MFLKYKIVLGFFMFNFFCVFSQKIDSIKTIEQANEYIQKYRDNIPPLKEGVSEEEAFKVFSDYYKKGPKLEEIIIANDSVNFYKEKVNKVNSKVLDISKTSSIRVSYIYFDGAKLDMDEINRLRKSIILEYKNGISFEDLSNKYTMDSAKDGDLGWADEGMLVKTFTDAVKNHNKGDVFIIDIPENKWYYVVLKTYNDIQKTKITYLIKED